VTWLVYIPRHYKKLVVEGREIKVDPHHTRFFSARCTFLLVNSGRRRVSTLLLLTHLAVAHTLAASLLLSIIRIYEHHNQSYYAHQARHPHSSLGSSRRAACLRRQSSFCSSCTFFFCFLVCREYADADRLKCEQKLRIGDDTKRNMEGIYSAPDGVRS
jgi:hypothetical protein